MKIIKKNESFELKKHIAAIHCHGKISLLQRKIANALLFHAYNKLLTEDEHIIQISELTQLIGFDSNDHRKIKDALIALLSTVIEWNVIDEQAHDTEIWNASSIISDVSIRGSTCKYSYSNKMKNLLYHPIKYGKIDLAIQAKFQSGYGLTLYENCNRYQSIGTTSWFSMKVFRKLMGVEDNKYLIFRDLNSRVIKKAVQEVNDFTQMIIEPELKKQNRQVVAIRFVIKQKKIIPAVSENSEGLIDQLQSQFGLSAKQINQIFKSYEPTYIKNKIQIILTSESYKNGKIKKLNQYLLAALKDDYQASATIEKEKKLEVSEVFCKQYESYKKQNYLATFNALTIGERLKVEENFKQYINKSVYSELFEQWGLENTLVQDQFNIFLQKELKVEEIMPIEKFSMLIA